MSFLALNLLKSLLIKEPYKISKEFAEKGEGEPLEKPSFIQRLIAPEQAERIEAINREWFLRPFAEERERVLEKIRNEKNQADVAEKAFDILKGAFGDRISRSGVFQAVKILNILNEKGLNDDALAKIGHIALFGPDSYMRKQAEAAGQRTETEWGKTKIDDELTKNVLMMLDDIKQTAQNQNKIALVNSLVDLQKAYVDLQNIGNIAETRDAQIKIALLNSKIQQALSEGKYEKVKELVDTARNEIDAALTQSKIEKSKTNFEYGLLPDLQKLQEAQTRIALWNANKAQEGQRLIDLLSLPKDIYSALLMNQTAIGSDLNRILSGQLLVAPDSSGNLRVMSNPYLQNVFKNYNNIPLATSSSLLTTNSPAGPQKVVRYNPLTGEFTVVNAGGVVPFVGTTSIDDETRRRINNAISGQTNFWQDSNPWRRYNHP
jgi:hypothetical protein